MKRFIDTTKQTFTFSSCEGCPARCCDGREGSIFSELILEDFEQVSKNFPIVFTFGELGYLKANVLLSNGKDFCPYIVDYKCTIYDERPSVCRIYPLSQNIDNKVYIDDLCPALSSDIGIKIVDNGNLSKNFTHPKLDNYQDKFIETHSHLEQFDDKCNFEKNDCLEVLNRKHLLRKSEDKFIQLLYINPVTSKTERNIEHATHHILANIHHIHQNLSRNSSHTSRGNTQQLQHHPRKVLLERPPQQFNQHHPTHMRNLNPHFRRNDMPPRTYHKKTQRQHAHQPEYQHTLHVRQKQQQDTHQTRTNTQQEPYVPHGQIATHTPEQPRQPDQKQHTIDVGNKVQVQENMQQEAMQQSPPAALQLMDVQTRDQQLAPMPQHTGVQPSIHHTAVIQQSVMKPLTLQHPQQQYPVYMPNTHGNSHPMPHPQVPPPQVARSPLQNIHQSLSQQSHTQNADQPHTPVTQCPNTRLECTPVQDHTHQAQASAMPLHPDIHPPPGAHHSWFPTPQHPIRNIHMPPSQTTPGGVPWASTAHMINSANSALYNNSQPPQ